MPVKRIIVKCGYCGIDREIYPANKSKLCASCSAKKRFNSLELHNKEIWTSPCKRCGIIRTYCRIKTWKQRRELCVSCSQIKTTEHYNREYQKYKGLVWSETNRQPLYLLENFDKRGKSGVDGAYQIDHVISIKYGFDNKINPNIIGNIKNLQMLPWKENRNKSSKIVTY